MRILLIAILALVTLALLIAAALYFGSLDWRFSHSRAVAALPLYRPDVSDDGEYQVEANGMRFRARLYGMGNTGDTIVMLHGFPESSLSWDHLARSAAAEGYRVIAFDQRGYSPGARPTGVAAYALRALVADVLAVADVMEAPRFHLVGHDWGAAVGWTTVADHGERIISWTAFSIAQVGIFMDAVLNDPQQRERSGYFAFNRRPWVPEFLATYGGQRMMKKLLAGLPPELLKEYLAILAEPGAMTAVLNWYRAMDVQELAADATLRRPVTVPTLFFWGANDPVIAEGPILRQAGLMQGPYESVRLDAGHGLVREARDTITVGALRHFRTHRVEGAVP